MRTSSKRVRLLTGLAAIDNKNQYFVFTNRETGPDLVPQLPNFQQVPQPVRATFRPARILWEQTGLPLAARHKFAAVGLVELTKALSTGAEASYIGEQYLADGRTTPGYPLFALVVRYHTGPWTLALNGENILDYRQTRRERVVQGPLDNPVFSQLWAPVEGRVINFSLTWRWAKS